MSCLVSLASLPACYRGSAYYETGSNSKLYVTCLDEAMCNAEKDADQPESVGQSVDLLSRRRLQVEEFDSVSLYRKRQ